MEQIKTGQLSRQFNFERDQVDAEARTVTLSFSSEKPVERWFGTEVLSHSPESVDLTRLNAKAALLANHDLNDQIGVIENATVENGRGIATVRFSKSERGEEFYQDVLDGIRLNVSVGYTIEEMEEKSERVFTATQWAPHEISLVSTPADFSVGIGRSDAVSGDHLTRVINFNKGNSDNGRPKNRHRSRKKRSPRSVSQRRTVARSYHQRDGKRCALPARTRRQSTERGLCTRSFPARSL
jgi:hypothetical protein